MVCLCLALVLVAASVIGHPSLVIGFWLLTDGYLNAALGRRSKWTLICKNPFALLHVPEALLRNASGRI